MERNHLNHTMWLDLFDLALRILLRWLHETIPATPPVQATAALLCPSVSQTVLLPTSTDALHVLPYPLDRIIYIIPQQTQEHGLCGKASLTSCFFLFHHSTGLPSG